MSVSSLVTSGWIGDPITASPRIIIVQKLIDGTINETQSIVGLLDPDQALSGSLISSDPLFGTIVFNSLAGQMPSADNLVGTISEECIIEPFAIESFAATVGSFVEVGSEISLPSFVAAFSKNPDDATLSDSEATPIKDVSSTPTNFNSDGTFTKTQNNESVTFTLNASLQGTSDSSQFILTWAPIVFTGISSSPGPYTEEEIKLLVNQNLNSSANFSGFVSPINQYIVHAYPDSFGPLLPANFQIGEIGPGDMSEVQAGLPITNEKGVTQNYTIARSDHLIDVSLGDAPLDFIVTV